MFCEKSVVRNFAKFTGKHLCQSLFFNKVACNFIKKETLTQVFCCEFCEISKNTFSYRTPLMAAFVDIQSAIRFFKRNYFDYLPPLNIESFLITPTNSTEISNIISSLNLEKSDGHIKPTGNPFQSTFFHWNYSFNFENQQNYTDI